MTTVIQAFRNRTRYEPFLSARFAYHHAIILYSGRDDEYAISELSRLRTEYLRQARIFNIEDNDQ